MSPSSTPIDPKTESLLKENELFGGVSEWQLEQLARIVYRKTVSQGQFICQEGDCADEVFVVLSGEFEVVKKESESQKYYRLGTLRRGASIGEVALLDGNPRSASVRSAAEGELLAMRIDDLHALHSPQDSAASRIKVNLGAQMARNFRTLNETTVKSLHQQLAEAKARATAGIFVNSLFVAVCCFVFALQIGASLLHGKVPTSVLSVPFFILFFVMFCVAIRRSGQPMANYGVNTRNWKRAAAEACIFSVPFLILVVFTKWILIQYHPSMHNDHLFELASKMRLAAIPTIIDAIVYTIFSPCQEFIVRGSIQGSFEDFLVGRHRALKAILIANLVYSMMHLHMSISFSLLAFVPGLFWGWLYSRQKTLIGVSLSHCLIGLFAFFIVGFDTLIHIYQ